LCSTIDPIVMEKGLEDDNGSVAAKYNYNVFISQRICLELFSIDNLIVELCQFHGCISKLFFRYHFIVKYIDIRAHRQDKRFSVAQSDKFGHHATMWYPNLTTKGDTRN